MGGNILTAIQAIVEKSSLEVVEIFKIEQTKWGLLLKIS